MLDLTPYHDRLTEADLFRSAQWQSRGSRLGNVLYCVDFVSGGAIGGTFRVIANYAAARGFATFPTAPIKGAAADWLRFGEDLGGSAPTTGSLGPYSGRTGAVLDRVGIRQGLGSNVVNNDVGRNWFAAVDTAFHEGFHFFIARYLPTF